MNRSFFSTHQTFFGLLAGSIVLAVSLFLGVLFFKSSPKAYASSFQGNGGSPGMIVGGISALVHGKPAVVLIHANGNLSAQFLSPGVTFPDSNRVSLSCSQGADGAFSCFAIGADQELYQDLYNHGHPLWQRLNPVPVP